MRRIKATNRNNLTFLAGAMNAMCRSKWKVSLGRNHAEKMMENLKGHLGVDLLSMRPMR